jgi:hypothetical protein
MQQQLAMQDAQLTLAKKDAEVKKLTAEAQKAVVETQLKPEELRVKAISSLSNNLDEGNKDFEQRAKIADLMLREKDIDSNERIAAAQMMRKSA